LDSRTKQYIDFHYSALNPGNVSATPDCSSSTQAPAVSGATTVSGSAVPFTGDATLPTASETPGNTAGSRSLSTGAKTGIGIGVAVGVFSIIGFIVFFMYQRKRSLTGKSSQLGDKSLSTELDSENSRTEIDSKTVQEADSSTLPRHELDSTPMKSELDSRSNWPAEIDGHGVWPNEKDASFFGLWAQPWF
jgi:hypothetical protein